MEYLVGGNVPCLAHHESPRVGLYMGYNSSLDETARCAAKQPSHHPLYCDPCGADGSVPRCAQNRTSTAPHDSAEDGHHSCHGGLPSESSLVVEEGGMLMGRCSLFAPQPLGLSPPCSTRYDDLRHHQAESQTPPVARADPSCSAATYHSAISQADGVSFTTLSALFSSAPTWGETSTSSDELRVLVPLVVGGSSPFSQPQPQPVTPVGELTEEVAMPSAAGPWATADLPADWMNTTVRTLFLSLTGEEVQEEEVGAQAAASNDTAPTCMNRNTVDLLMAQLTEGSDVAARQARDSCPAPPPDGMAASRAGFGLCALSPGGCPPPCAVGCSPPGSPHGKLSGGAANANATATASASAGALGWHRGSSVDLPGAGRVGGGGGGGHRVNRFNYPPLNLSRVPVVDRTALSEVHRNTPQALQLKAMINKSGLDGVLMTAGWPLRTKSDVVALLKRLRAKELLRHLRIISFSRRDPQGVRSLFESWANKGIPPPDVLFGVYYRYAVKKCGKEMCLKHNGRGRAAGHGRGCDYASKGPLFRCRYHHACLFCRAEDHGWFDEANCERYMRLQRELVEFGVTGAVATVLLDALECNERPALRDTVA